MALIPGRDPALKPKSYVMHFEQNMKASAIAKELNLPLGTIAAWLSIERKNRNRVSTLQTEHETNGTTIDNQPFKITEQSSKDLGNRLNGMSSTLEPSDPDREYALKILRKSMKAREPLPEHQVDAANKILGRLAKPKAEIVNVDAWKEHYSTMKDNEIAERIITIGASMLGIERLQATLDRLKQASQADIVGDNMRES